MGCRVTFLSPSSTLAPAAPGCGRGPPPRPLAGTSRDARRTWCEADPPPPRALAAPACQSAGSPGSSLWPTAPSFLSGFVGGLLKSACGFTLIFKGFCHISNLTPRFLSGLFCFSESFPGRYIFYCCPGDFDFVSQTSAFLPNVLSAACLACRHCVSRWLREPGAAWDPGSAGREGLFLHRCTTRVTGTFPDTVGETVLPAAGETSPGSPR